MGNAVVSLQLEGLGSTLASRPQLHVESLGTNSQKKRILFVTSEFADLVKVGGLGTFPLPCPEPSPPATISAC